MKVLDFWGLHCAPCEKIGAYLTELQTEFPDISIEKIAVHENMNLAMEYFVKSVPTLVLIKEQEVVYKGNVGGMSKNELKDLIIEHA
jgi:thioredoxin 1